MWSQLLFSWKEKQRRRQSDHRLHHFLHLCVAHLPGSASRVLLFRDGRDWLGRSPIHQCAHVQVTFRCCVMISGVYRDLGVLLFLSVQQSWHSNSALRRLTTLLVMVGEAVYLKKVTPSDESWSVYLMVIGTGHFLPFVIMHLILRRLQVLWWPAWAICPSIQSDTSCVHWTA